MLIVRDVVRGVIVAAAAVNSRSKSCSLNDFARRLKRKGSTAVE